MKIDQPTFERVVDMFYEALYRFAYSLTRHESEAGDLTQETFYIWATKGHQLRDPKKVKSWLFTTLHREFLGMRRRSGRYPHHDLEALAGELPAVEPQTVRRMDGALVLSLLHQVDEVYRSPLILFYLEDHSYSDIASILEIPMGTVMSRLSRGKAQLRNLISKQVRPESSNIVHLNQKSSQNKSQNEL